MSDLQACLLCGDENRDVKVGLVEFPPSEQRVVTVSLVVEQRRTGPKTYDHREVRERWASLPRCADHGPLSACAGRVAAIERAAAVPPVEEDMAWMG